MSSFEQQTVASAFGNHQNLSNHGGPHTAHPCCICMDLAQSPMTLRCGHAYCKHCIDAWFNTKPTCPSCGEIYGKVTGNQPKGTMTFQRSSSKLPGYETARGTILIQYNFSGGVQGAEHPHPGRGYSATARTAYLPDCEEGDQVLSLLRRAFDARLVFTVGRSATTGLDDQITWNDIHHKTSTSGGPQSFGFPDPTYLSRLKEELAMQGIK